MLREVFWAAPRPFLLSFPSIPLILPKEEITQTINISE